MLVCAQAIRGSLPSQLIAILVQALQDNPLKRYRRAADMLAALSKV